MKKNALLVIAVVAVALCLYYFFMRPEPKLAEQPGTAPSAPSQEEFAAPVPGPGEPEQSSEKKENAADTKLPPGLEQTTVSKPAPGQTEPVVTEQMLKDLEKNWDDLKRQVNLHEETEGFRVSYLDKGSAFVKSGLQEGDLIRYDQIYEMKKKAKSMEEKRIADRWIKILNHVNVDENN